VSETEPQPEPCPSVKRTLQANYRAHIGISTDFNRIYL